MTEAIFAVTPSETIKYVLHSPCSIHHHTLLGKTDEADHAICSEPNSSRTPASQTLNSKVSSTAPVSSSSKRVF
jgi:hypothetical protein